MLMTLAEARAKNIAASQMIEMAKAELEKCDVRSPVTGVVLRKNTSEGELISIYLPKPLMVVSEIQNYRVRAEVDEHDLPRIRAGQTVEVVIFPSDKMRLRGKVSSIAPTMGRRQILTTDPADKSDRDVVEVLIALESKPENLPIGLRVSVIFLD
jgi:HlyD family secretion protein